MIDQFPVSAFEISPDTYVSTTEPRHTVAMWNFGIVHKDQPESLVYEVMGVVLENHDRMMQIHGASEETLLENWVHNTFLPFHPGAVRYLRDQGLDVPDHLIPPEMAG